MGGPILYLIDSINGIYLVNGIIWYWYWGNLPIYKFILIDIYKWYGTY
jgi:hypothetical protein